MEEAPLLDTKSVFGGPADFSISGWRSVEKALAYLEEAAKRGRARRESPSAFLRSPGCDSGPSTKKGEKKRRVFDFGGPK